MDYCKKQVKNSEIMLMLQNLKVILLINVDAKVELLNDEGYSPFLFVEVDGSDGADDGTVLFYGHMDK
jgi:hypothetical protein